jgi:hypothetical protein
VPNRYVVVCATCRYQSFHSSRWEANIDVAAHLRDNPTHSASVVEEGRRVTGVGSAARAAAREREAGSGANLVGAERSRDLAAGLHHTRARGGPA